MVLKTDLRISAEGGIELGAWLFLPEGDGRHPAITMAHGFAGTREHGIERFAQAFATAGFVVLVHDHRNFGTSGGDVRGDIDPWRQITDWRRAISCLEARPEVDPTRIGLWGTSYAGGHAIVLGATDRRVRCVVAQVPTISGYEQGLRRVSPDALPALERAFAEDERAQFHGAPPRRQAVVNDDPSMPAAYRSQDAIDFYHQPLPQGVWENEITLRSTRAARMYEPGTWLSRVSPTPLLMVVARDRAVDHALAMQSVQRVPVVTLPGACSIVQRQVEQRQHGLVDLVGVDDHCWSPLASHALRCAGPMRNALGIGSCRAGAVSGPLNPREGLRRGSIARDHAPGARCRPRDAYDAAE